MPPPPDHRRVQTLTSHLTAASSTRPLPNNNAPLSSPLTVPTSPNFVGNFAPITDEGHFINLKVTEGAIPKDLESGMYARVGPNPKFDFTDKPYHTFDGDGYVHAVTFTANGGPVSYTKRWVRTRRLMTNESRGFDVSELGLMAYGRLDYFDLIVDSEDYLPDPRHRMGRANTNLVSHAGRLYALEEQDKPYELVASWDGDSNLRTVGRRDFRGKLTHHFTAHPKVDPVTGEMMFFGYDIMEPRVFYSVCSPTGELVRTVEIPLPATVMMHDMVITDELSILFDQRLEFTVEALQEGKDPWIHRRDLPARFGVMPRHATSPDQVRWIDVKSCALFHFANAWTEKNNVLVIVGVRIHTVNLNKFEDKVKAGKNKKSDGGGGGGDVTDSGVLYEWRLDLSSNTCISERAISNHVCDFVQIDPACIGRKNRFVYGSLFETNKKAMPRPEYKDALYVISGLLKWDLQTGQCMQYMYKTRDGRPAYGTEAVFAPRVGRDVHDEDGGYIIVYVHDDAGKANDTSDCLVLDAKTLELKARIAMGDRVPYGFHGIWLHGKDLV